MSNYKDLLAYKRAFKLALDIFKITRRFPKEELYSLTDQIRRSSRSVCSNFAEAYRRRQYPKHFVAKLADCDAENTETGVWLDFAFAFKYIMQPEYDQLYKQRDEVGKLLSDMIKYPMKYC
ncbi:MAG: four helix bundle protein [Chitinophagaceae bacterium]